MTATVYDKIKETRFPKHKGCLSLSVNPRTAKFSSHTPMQALCFLG